MIEWKRCATGGSTIVWSFRPAKRSLLEKAPSNPTATSRVACAGAHANRMRRRAAVCARPAFGDAVSAPDSCASQCRTPPITRAARLFRLHVPFHESAAAAKSMHYNLGSECSHAVVHWLRHFCPSNSMFEGHSMVSGGAGWLRRSAQDFFLQRPKEKSRPAQLQHLGGVIDSLDQTHWHTRANEHVRALEPRPFVFVFPSHQCAGV